MSTEEFVKAFFEEKNSFLEEYLSENSKTEVGELIKKLKLDDNQIKIFEKILNLSFTDIFYTILLGLDGSTSIGGIQELYELKDEEGNLISGEIEPYAYEYFHNSKN